MHRLHRWIAGEDGPAQHALPLGEFLHPVPLAALALLVVNDHVLKQSGSLSGWLTGKLSDFAGNLFFPLLLTALGDTAACGLARLLGLRLDFSLRRWKLAAALAVTAGVFAPLKLSPAFAAWYVEALGCMGFPSQVALDPWDLTALAMLLPAWWLGCREIGRVPLGRLEVIARAAAGGDLARVRAALADARALGRDPGAVDALSQRYAAWLAARSESNAAAVIAILRRIRG